MHSFVKTLLATAVIVSCAVPALAIDYNSDSFILDERFAHAAPQPRMNMRSNHWSNAYAMEQRPYNRMRRSAWSDQSPYANFGADQVNGGL